MLSRIRMVKLTLVLTALGACGSSGSPAEERAIRARMGEGDILIAVAWPWTSPTDLQFEAGLDLAVAEVNAAGGVSGRQIRLLKMDDRGSINDGLLVAAEIAGNPDVVAVIGHLNSYVTVPAAAIYDRAGLVHIVPASTSPELTTKGYSRLFRGIFTDLDTGREIATYAAERGYQRIGIYYVRNPYGRSVANAFEERASDIGLSVTARASYDGGRQDPEGRGFERVLEEWKQLKLDAIFVAGQVPEAGILIAAARRRGLDMPVLGSDAMYSPALIMAAGAAAEGTVVPVPFHPAEPRPEVIEFVAAFQHRYGRVPDAGAAVGYDAANLLVHAFRLAQTTAPDEVARALHSLRDWPGLTGRLTFDEKGDLVKRKMIWAVVRDGDFEVLDRVAGKQAAVDEWNDRPTDDPS